MHAVERMGANAQAMGANAQAMGANAVTLMRFDSSEIGQTLAEVVADGSALVVMPRGNRQPSGADWAV